MGPARGGAGGDAWRAALQSLLEQPASAAPFGLSAVALGACGVPPPPARRALFRLLRAVADDAAAARGGGAMIVPTSATPSKLKFLRGDEVALSAAATAAAEAEAEAEAALSAAGGTAEPLATPTPAASLTAHICSPSALPLTSFLSPAPRALRATPPLRGWAAWMLWSWRGARRSPVVCAAAALLAYVVAARIRAGVGADARALGALLRPCGEGAGEQGQASAAAGGAVAARGGAVVLGRRWSVLSAIIGQRTMSVPDAHAGRTFGFGCGAAVALAARDGRGPSSSPVAAAGRSASRDEGEGGGSGGGAAGRRRRLRARRQARAGRRMARAEAAASGESGNVGIVMAADGSSSKYADAVYVALHNIRTLHRCSLPVEVFHVGEAERFGSGVSVHATRRRALRLLRLHSSCFSCVCQFPAPMLCRPPSGCSPSIASGFTTYCCGCTPACAARPQRGFAPSRSSHSRCSRAPSSAPF